MPRPPAGSPPLRLPAHPELNARLRVPKPGRPPQVNRRSIVDAAVDVGFEEMSVSAVARRLGVTHSTLYRYFATKDELVAAAANQVVAAVDWPAPTAGWRPYLRAVARAAFRLFEQYPGLALRIAGLRVGLAEFARQGVRTASVLVDMGFDAESAVLAQDMLHEQVLLYFLAGRAAGEADSGSGSAVEPRRAPVADPGEEDGRTAAGSAVAEALGRVGERSPEAWFHRKVQLLLDGIAASAPRPWPLRQPPGGRRHTSGAGRRAAGGTRRPLPERVFPAAPGGARRVGRAIGSVHVDGGAAR
ncbi:TetR/AcrR family transcriptional regulator [Streptomyces sp. NBC_01477]|uniref:TetR/AcrR family transcriptional regulator n=1 Tax=Streptomyces sp. NBC_01477 TaxID=2976015 RepID=UPI002E372902|nr:TetR/AcrR family transcriptional regulator [Streptomyces sp. NBC_01477]